MKSPITKLAAAAVIVIAVFIGIEQFDTNSPSVVWADVAERFESVPFFNITIYLRDPSNKTRKIEIWKSEDSRIRAHEGNKVFFKDLSKDKNKFTIFDRSTKKLVNGDENLPSFIRRLCGNEGRFSLDTLTESFPSDVKGIIPLETADTAASKETVLFRAKAKEIAPERLKIWALRESKLPIRFFVRPDQGYMDLFFDYSEQKDAAFFDPAAFTNQ
jgi:outer membrane lipoprotein-sorting protein